MKKKVNDFMFGIYCCVGVKTIAVILFYLLFLISYFEKNYLLMCDYYGMCTDNFNTFVLFIFSNGYFLILFLPVTVLMILGNVYRFCCCDTLRLLKCKNRMEIVLRYMSYSFFLITGIMVFLLLGMLATGKLLHMHITADGAFIPNFVFTYISLMVMALLYLFCAVWFSSEGMGAAGVVIPLLFELLVWKKQIKGMFAYTYFYNIVEQDIVPIPFMQKILFWILCLIFLTSVSLIAIWHVDLGVSRNVKEVVSYVIGKYYINPWYVGAVLWSFLFVTITYLISKDFYSSPKEFVYICFRGFLGTNIQDLIFYLSLCLPLWVYLAYYFSKFFTAFSIYIFMKAGGILKHMLKCLGNTVRYIVFYFFIMVFLAYITGNSIYQGTGKVMIYQDLPSLSDSMIGAAVDFALVTLLMVLFIMVMYLFCYRLEIAFMTGIGCHILNAVIAGFVSYGKELIPFTQNLLLIRDGGYSRAVARCFLCMKVVVMFFAFCYLMKRKQEKILTGYYRYGYTYVFSYVPSEKWSV